MFLSKRVLLLDRTVKISLSLVNSISTRSCRLCAKANTVENSTEALKAQELVMKELISSLDCPSQIAKHIVTVHPEIAKVDIKVLKDNIVNLVALGYKKESLYGFPKVLSLDPLTLHNRALILEESQVTQSARLLYNYKGFIKLRVSLLKAYGLIDEEADVVNGLLSRVGNVPKLKSTTLNESQNLVDLYVAIMKAYVNKRLNVENESDAATVKKSTLRELSIRHMKSNIAFLLNVAGFSKQMVLENFKYVRKMNSATLLVLLDLFKSKGCDIRKLWQTRPQMLTLNYQKVLETLKLLEEFDVPFVAALQNPEVFKVPAPRLRKNLIFIDSVRELRILKFHPRFLELVINPEFAMKQLERYNQLDFNKMSLSLLVDGTPKTKQAYTFSTMIGQGDLLAFVSKELNRPREEIKAKLSLHPYWSTISLLQVEETLKFLLNKHFRKDEIVESLQILLYPRVRVELEMLLLDKRDFRECRAGLTIGRGKIPVKKEFVLPLVLYFIEKGTKFSGDAVWLDNTFRTLDDTDFEDDAVHQDADPDYFKNQKRVVTSRQQTSKEAQSFT